MDNLILDVATVMVFALGVMASARLSTINLIILAEFVWVLFFFYLNLLSGLSLSGDYVTLYFLFLAIATIDLAVSLAIVLAQGAASSGEPVGVGVQGASGSSVSEGAGLRNS